LEMASGVQLASTWVDTRHQPADGGTRCDALGRLHLDRPRWTHLQLVVEIFAGCACITTECEAAGLSTSPPWDILRGAQFDLRNKKIYGPSGISFLQGTWLSSGGEPHAVVSLVLADGMGARPLSEIAQIRRSPVKVWKGMSFSKCWREISWPTLRRSASRCVQNMVSTRSSRTQCVLNFGYTRLLLRPFHLSMHNLSRLISVVSVCRGTRPLCSRVTCLICAR
jgi:hypothetical protein